MADITIKVLEAANNFDLMTLDELKLALGISTTTEDPALEDMITRYSDVIAEACNRVFAKEKVRETWRCDQSRRLFLSHWPIKEADVESVEVPRGTVVDPSTYELEEKSGKLSLYLAAQVEPIVVTYTGGYELPDEAPPALKQACELLIRQDRMIRQMQSLGGARSISHRDARVMYFDPMAAQRAASGGGKSMVGDAITDLLMSYVRFYV